MSHIRTFRRLAGLATISLCASLALSAPPSAAHADPSRQPGDPMAYVIESGQNQVSAVDLSLQSEYDVIPVGSQPDGIVATPDGRTVYVANAGSDDVSIIDVATDTVKGHIDVGSSPGAMAVTPNGKLLYVGNGNSNTVSVIDTATNTVTTTIAEVPQGPSMVSNASGSTIWYTAGFVETYITTIDTSTQVATIARFHTDGYPQEMALTPDGSRIVATTNVPSGIEVLNTATDNPTLQMGTSSTPSGVAMNSSGTRAYVVGNDQIQPINVTTSTPISAVPLQGASAIAVDQQGLLYVTDGAGNLDVVDPETLTVQTPISLSAPGSAIALANPPAS